MHFSSFFRIPLLQFGQRILARTCLLVLLFLLAYLQAFISCTFAFSFTKFSAQFLLNKQPFLPCPGCEEFIMKVKEISKTFIMNSSHHGHGRNGCLFSRNCAAHFVNENAQVHEINACR